MQKRMRIICVFLSVIMLVGAFPMTASGTIDPPLTGPAGTGWDDFGPPPFDPPDNGSGGGLGNSDNGIIPDDNRPDFDNDVNIEDFPIADNEADEDEEIEETVAPYGAPEASGDGVQTNIPWLAYWLEDTARWARMRSAGSPSVQYMNFTGEIQWGSGPNPWFIRSPPAADYLQRRYSVLL